VLAYTLTDPPEVLVDVYANSRQHQDEHHKDGRSQDREHHEGHNLKMYEDERTLV